MRWTQVSENWPAFYEAILDRWPDAEEEQLDEIDGDQRAFIRYIAELTETDGAEARDEISQWLAGEIPSDVVMDEFHDNHSINLSRKYVGEGEDESDNDAFFGDDDDRTDDD